jgi:MoaA/NifB/PqqE/SkfB family radical SAM enzyme
MIVDSQRVALFYMTTRCNLSCSHCCVGAGCDTISDGSMLDANGIVEVIAACSRGNVGFLTMTGGEPFLKSDIGDILNRSVGYGVKIGVDTNLTILPKCIDYIVENRLLAELHVSVDGSSALIHDRVRGEGSYAKMIKNLEAVLRLLEKYGACKDIKIDFTTVLFNHNKNDLGNIVKLAADCGVKNIRFNSLIMNGRAKFNYKYICLDGDALLDVSESILSYKMKYSEINIHYDGLTNLFIEYYNNKYGSRIGYSYHSCPSPSQYLYISYDGSVFPCALYSRQLGGNGACGFNSDIRCNSIDEILRNDKFLEFEDTKKTIDYSKMLIPCARCKFFGNYCQPCTALVMSGGVQYFLLCKTILSQENNI